MSLFVTNCVCNELFVTKSPQWCWVCTLVVKVSCGSDGISIHLELQYRGFGHCVVDEAKPLESKDSEPCSSWWLGKKLFNLQLRSLRFGLIRLKCLESWCHFYCPWRDAFTCTSCYQVLSCLCMLCFVLKIRRRLHCRRDPCLINMSVWLGVRHPILLLNSHRKWFLFFKRVSEIGYRSFQWWHLLELAQLRESLCWFITISISVDPTTAADLR